MDEKPCVECGHPEEEHNRVDIWYPCGVEDCECEDYQEPDDD